MLFVKPCNKILNSPFSIVQINDMSRYLSGCNIGCKTLFCERGKLPLKLTCPACTFTCPPTLLNKEEIGLCPKHYLLSGASEGLVQLAPLLFFAEFTYNLQQGQWLCCTLPIIVC